MPERFPETERLRHWSRQLVRELGLLNQPLKGFSMSQCHTLIEIERGGMLEVAELADLLRVDKSTLSRLATKLQREGLVAARTNTNDRRRKPLVLTEDGKKKVTELHELASGQVEQALAHLSEDERSQVISGFALYVQALSRARRLRNCVIRPITESDNGALACIIRQTLREFHIGGEGFADMDPEMERLHSVYKAQGARYLVALMDNKILGGGGVSRLKGGAEDVCELQKMYLIPEGRGFGLGARLLKLCFQAARDLGYRHCYLETHSSMHKAQALYRSFGFEVLKGSMGATGHTGCNQWYMLSL